MNALLQKLSMKDISPIFDEAYEKAVRETETPFWLTEEYILRVAAKTGIINKHLENVLKTLEAVNKLPDLKMFAKTLYFMLAKKEEHEKTFVGLEFPETDITENRLAYDMFAVLPILGHIEATYESLLEKGIDEDILQKTYSIDGCIDAASLRMNRLGFSKIYFLWCTLYVNGTILRLGRLDFEIKKASYINIRAFKNNLSGEIKLFLDNTKIHPSGFVAGSVGCPPSEADFTAEYSETADAYIGYAANSDTALCEKTKTALKKTEWTPVFAPGDSVLNVHIPTVPDPFNKETCEEAYNMAKELYKNKFPEYDFKGFICYSWLLSTDLKPYLKPTSNIMAFQEKFYRFPMLSNGVDVFSFVFHIAVSSVSEIDAASLPENTSLEKNIKELTANGGYIHEFGGFFPM